MSQPLSLSESQWNTIMQTVHDEALRARVAASFLPLFGPLPGDTQTIPKNELQYDPKNKRLSVLDYENIRLATLSINVYLKNAQIADPELTSAMIMFRRAAELMARVEDAVIFNGQSDVGGNPNFGGPLQEVYTISGGESSGGLLGAGNVNSIPIAPPEGDPYSGMPFTTEGQQVFNAIVLGIEQIERQGYHGPFACVLGDELFKAINTPMPSSMVLPRDGILPFLDAPLLRSSAIPENYGVIVSLRGAPVEIVVPSDITVRHITTTAEGEHVFRVQQKFVLRVKEAGAVATIST